jgi:hypothetical protein
MATVTNSRVLRRRVRVPASERWLSDAITPRFIELAMKGSGVRVPASALAKRGVGPAGANAGSTGKAWRLGSTRSACPIRQDWNALALPPSSDAHER